jgi:hypothetical protein
MLYFFKLLILTAYKKPLHYDYLITVCLNLKSEFLSRLGNAAYNIPIINSGGDMKNTNKILARLIFKKQGWRMWTTSIWLRTGSSSRLL